MAYPTQSEVEIPLLKALDALGGKARPRDVYPLVAKSFPNLTEEEQSRRMENAPSSRKWWNLVQWVRQRLVELDQIDGSVRGVWKITETGRRRLQGEPVSNIVARRDVAVGQRSSVTQRNEVGENTLDATLSDLVNENHEQIKRRIMTELQELSPPGFERFCSVLLGHIGYEDLIVTRKAGDGGIDGHGDFRQGVVRFKSAFQAKRWKDASVGRPEIDKFRGAIQGEFDHGVFLTTSRFSQEAQDASIKRGAITLLLLDGNAIAELMIERGIGVIKQPLYLAELDEDFFDFDE